METRTKPTSPPTLLHRHHSPSPFFSRPISVLSALLAFALAACSGSNATAGSDVAGGSDTDARPAPGRTVMVLSLPDTQSTFFQQVREGAEQEAEAQQIELAVTDAKGSAATQAGRLQRLSPDDTDAVIVAPVDSRSVADAVRALRSDDVSVIAVDRRVQGARTDMTISSHNSAGGWKAAETLSELLGGEGRIIVLRGPGNTSVSRERGKGFTTALAEHPGIEVVDTARAGFDRVTARKAMARLLAEHPEVAGVFAENDEMALGAVDALGHRAGSSVQVIGFDGTPEALAAVESGRLAATVQQAPVDMGRLAVRNALRLVNGESVDRTIEVPVSVARADG